MSSGLIIALVCAIIAIVYGAVSIQWILSRPAGNARMQEIAAAIQQGAQAYLNRQYMTISVVGVVLFLILGIVIGWPARRATSACSFQCAPTCAPPKRPTTA